MNILPLSRPKLNRQEVEERARAAGVTSKVYLLGIRGYYSNSFAPAGNNRGVYDDAIFLVTPTKFLAFNANTDPSIKRKGIATLKPGVHPYKPGNHGISKPGGGYPALRPATPGEQLPVTRDGVDVNPRPGVAINIHKGSRNSTSSEGCQTIYPDQWPEFIREVYNSIDHSGQETIPYALVTE